MNKIHKTMIDINLEEVRAGRQAPFYFAWKNCYIFNPYRNEIEEVEVNPVDYYGEAFTCSCFEDIDEKSFEKLLYAIYVKSEVNILLFKEGSDHYKIVYNHIPFEGSIADIRKELVELSKFTIELDENARNGLFTMVRVLSDEEGKLGRSSTLTPADRTIAVLNEIESKVIEINEREVFYNKIAPFYFISPKHHDMTVVDPYSSECGRFELDPIEEYGESYINWRNSLPLFKDIVNAGHFTLISNISDKDYTEELFIVVYNLNDTLACSVNGIVRTFSTERTEQLLVNIANSYDNVTESELLMLMLPDVVGYTKANDLFLVVQKKSDICYVLYVNNNLLTQGSKQTIKQLIKEQSDFKTDIKLLRF